jgi:hypothetical protein
MIVVMMAVVMVMMPVIVTATAAVILMDMAACQEGKPAARCQRHGGGAHKAFFHPVVFTAHDPDPYFLVSVARYTVS